MPKGGARPGAGAPLGSRNNPAGRRGKPKLAVSPPVEGRPQFRTGRDFALWCLNAADAEAPMEVKVRAMQALIALEAKAPGEAKKPAAAPPAAGPDIYAPRAVRAFGVVAGGR